MKYSISTVDKLFSRIAFSPWWHLIQNRFKFLAPFEKILLKHGCDLVYFPTPSTRSASLQSLNYITTVWDLCHRDTPEFPEVREYSLFHKREHFYKNYLSSALLIITDSLQLSLAISNRYGIDIDRLLHLPFSPSPFLKEHMSNDSEIVLKKYDLKRGYFFYPAQFWSHKNHIRILEALVILNKRNIYCEVVFAGGDQGNQAHVENFIVKNKLSKNVKLLGFVPAEDMRGLYENCNCVIMPTYFGHTNLPPLEAWSFGKPLIYSEHLREQVGEAAILVNPDSDIELAGAMADVLDSNSFNDTIQNGYEMLKQIQEQQGKSESLLYSYLLKFIN